MKKKTTGGRVKKKKYSKPRILDEKELNQKIMGCNHKYLGLRKKSC